MARALVVDDDIIRELINYKLERMGLMSPMPRTASGRWRWPAANPYDLLLLDLMMPRMSGIEVCEARRAAGDTTPIIMLTGRVQEGDVEAGFAAGADDHMTKPISVVELGSRGRRQLQRAGV